MQRLSNAVITTGFFFFFSIQSNATVRENQFGPGSISASLAGAGIASVTGGAATHLNPANLSRCESRGVELGFKYLSTQFNVNQEDGANRKVNQLGNLLVAELGGCIAPLTGLGIGLWTSSGASRPVSVGLTTQDNEIHFARFGSALLAPTIMGGVGYAFMPQLSVGLGVSVSMHTSISQDVYAPLSESQKPFSADLEATVLPRAAFVAGVTAQPWDFLGVGATFRSAGFGRLDVNAKTQAAAVGLEIPPIKVDLSGVLDYSPRQYAIGITAKPHSSVSLLADVSYAFWSKYPGPFLSATPDSTSAVSSGIPLPVVEQFAFRNVFIPKFGAEIKIIEHVAARVGYAYHPTIIALPAQNTNLIDGDTHTISMGGGYRMQTASAGFHADFFVATHLMPRQAVTKNATFGSTKYSFGGMAISTGLNAGIDF